MIMFCMLGNEQIQSGIIPSNELEDMFDLDSAPANVGAPAEQSAGIHVRFSNNTVTGGTNISTNAQADFHNNASQKRNSFEVFCFENMKKIKMCTVSGVANTVFKYFLVQNFIVSHFS